MKPRPFCEPCVRTAMMQETRYGERAYCLGCGRWSWDRKPLADAATHKARQAAHAIFDKLWKPGPLKIMNRSAAYALLQRELGLTPDECHMAVMDAETAGRVPDAVEALRLRYATTRQPTEQDAS